MERKSVMMRTNLIVVSFVSTFFANISAKAQVSGANAQCTIISAQDFGKVLPYHGDPVPPANASCSVNGESGYVSNTSSGIGMNSNSQCQIKVTGRTIDVPYEQEPAPPYNAPCKVAGISGLISKTSAPSPQPQPAPLKPQPQPAPLKPQPQPAPLKPPTTTSNAEWIICNKTAEELRVAIAYNDLSGYFTSVGWYSLAACGGCVTALQAQETSRRDLVYLRAKTANGGIFIQGNQNDSFCTTTSNFKITESNKPSSCVLETFKEMPVNLNKEFTTNITGKASTGALCTD